MKFLNGYLSALITLSLILISFGSAATEVKVWKHTPLPVELPVGKESIILFSDNVRVGLPMSLQGKVKLTSLAGAVYLTALEKFPKTRLQVIYISTGEKALLDVYSKNVDADFEPEDLKIITAQEAEIKVGDQVEALKESSKVSVKDFIQYAAQDWFAPERLKPYNRRITSREITKDVNLDLLFMGKSSGLFELKALKEYSTGQYILTAIGIQNRTLWEQDIDYSDIDPFVIAASSQPINAQPTLLGPKGSEGDTTILYVVTESPLIMTTVAYYE